MHDLSKLQKYEFNLRFIQVLLKQEIWNYIVILVSFFVSFSLCQPKNERKISIAKRNQPKKYGCDAKG